MIVWCEDVSVVKATEHFLTDFECAPQSRVSSDKRWGPDEETPSPETNPEESTHA